ncbi:hypothetical protein L3X38_033486 [Prunus dulcis]|uniref:Uncharacterized protein n=1 Tax=Prunus dulcis TaxID=3755 RepID=A0AAD4YXN7_PRUDU|nr:hypothetical protein L3X38_033486 [Prunus dulcis]
MKNCDYLLHKELHQPLIPHVFNASYSNNGTWPWKNYELHDNSFQLGFANCSNNGTMTGLADQIVSAGTSDYFSSTGEWGCSLRVNYNLVPQQFMEAAQPSLLDEALPISFWSNPLQFYMN